MQTLIRTSQNSLKGKRRSPISANSGLSGSRIKKRHSTKWASLERTLLGPHQVAFFCKRCTFYHLRPWIEDPAVTPERQHQTTCEVCCGSISAYATNVFEKQIQLRQIVLRSDRTTTIVVDVADLSKPTRNTWLGSHTDVFHHPSVSGNPLAGWHLKGFIPGLNWLLLVACPPSSSVRHSSSF